MTRSTLATDIAAEDLHSTGNATTKFSADRRLYGGSEEIPTNCDTTTALAIGGLDFEVETRPLMVGGPGGCEWVDNYMATVRTDTDKVLGVVSPNYEPIQNQRAFEVVEAGFVQRGLAQWNAGGTFRDGARVWGMLELLRDHPYRAGGDDMSLFMLYINDHSGKRAVTAMLNPVRLWCTNQLPVIVKNASNRVSVRHLADVDHKFEVDASTILSSADEYMGELTGAADELALKRATPATLDRLLEQLYPSGTDDAAHTRNVDTREAVKGLLASSDNLADHRGDLWGFVNAVSEWHLWGRNRRDPGASRVGQLVGGSSDDALTQKALRLALDA